MLTTTITKASEPPERHLLDRQYVRLLQGWKAIVRYHRSPEALRELAPLFARHDVKTIMQILSHSIDALSATWDDAAAEVAEQTRQRLSRKIGKATVSTVFGGGDPAAAQLMQRRKLQFLSDLTMAQRQTTQTALARGQQLGWGAERMARAFADSIGLSPSQQQYLDNYRATLERQVPDALDAGTPFADDLKPLSPDQIDRMLDRKATTYRDARALAIARTESLRVTGLAQDQALRQSLQATGIGPELVGREWMATRDGRTRDDHAAADGQRRRLGEPFDVGGESLMRPGDGSARQSVNCRCVTTEHFFETEQELQRWLEGGT